MKPHKRIESLKEINYAAEDYDSPTKECYELAHEMMEAILKNFKEPDRISCSIIGGICFGWLDRTLYADIEIYNDGKIYAMASGQIIENSVECKIDAWVIDVLPFDLLTTLQRFNLHFSDRIY